MGESTAPHPDNAPLPAGGAGRSAGRKKVPAWLTRTIVGVVAAVVLLVAYYIASVTVPLAWATSIRDQTGGKLGNAIPLGMFYGFVFAFVPVLVAWQAHHRKLNKWVRVGLLVAGLVLTLPNLLTLSVVYGNTASAADARAIWTTGGANWFGTWSQIFMVAGVVCAVAVIVLGRAWIRRGRRIRQIKAAEKLVRKNEQAKARADLAAQRAADKAARTAARAHARNPRQGPPSTPSEPDAPGAPEA
ncbi:MULTISPECIES: hypothetical protein [unclassified Arthrobacter]|uniref:hypothetical protein n=1 Tax=unclassified Arthrobacter TaxID=235627 RepID=UPI00159D74D7|nr:MULTISPECIES: hypothetical protein [unclassified Arthrobacter]MCQ9164294.1 hypothetical protein [Arthrobacter sp. STN4]NVM99473.1 hypothetical protein [Arthrobacter sp. SDTb3-6]